MPRLAEILRYAGFRHFRVAEEAPELSVAPSVVYYA